MERLYRFAYDCVCVKTKQAAAAATAAAAQSRRQRRRRQEEFQSPFRRPTDLGRSRSHVGIGHASVFVHVAPIVAVASHGARVLPRTFQSRVATRTAGASVLDAILLIARRLSNANGGGPGRIDDQRNESNNNDDDEKRWSLASLGRHNGGIDRWSDIQFRHGLQQHGRRPRASSAPGQTGATRANLVDPTTTRSGRRRIGESFANGANFVDARQTNSTAAAAAAAARTTILQVCLVIIIVVLV
mmetsp:Transcript_21912/g.50470  ORF Transcript_21912/g.50470 Transcript_21912/m.50470 type:complete len:244 (-) Transcript_21912:1148-1879(-)